MYFEADENNLKLPYLEAIAITFIPDKQSEYLEFIQGNIDFISGIEDSYKDDIINKNGELNNKYLDRIKMLKTPYLNTEYIAFNLSEENSIANSKELKRISLNRKLQWLGAEKQEIFRKMYLQVQDSETYFSFMNSEAQSDLEDATIAAAIELGVGITVFAAMLSIFYAFAAQAERKNIQ